MTTPLTRLDLNLLVSLLALLEERNVTRAGQRLHISQPAMSSALARLRRHFDDELLSRCDHEYVLTPLARRLLPVLREMVAITERIVDTRWEFDPATAHRQFSVMVSDYAEMVLARPFTAVLSERAPMCSVTFLPLPDTHVEDVDTVLRRVDVVVLPHGFHGGYPCLDLFSDGWCVLAATTNIAVADRISPHQLTKFPHAVVSTAGDVALAAQLLAVDNLELWAQTRTPYFLALPFLVEGTDRIALVQRRQARRLCAAADVRIVDIEPTLPGITEAAWWHPMHDADPGHQWLRAVLAEASVELAGC
ncbi:LysR family transcriptional regulator [Nocardia abscessus]|uniref:LysR family transcriptional regulator n=1 Tax=Nocardia abscessus TaxID=120957 RepID=UPI002457EE8D|nr:LysR family transcriptional regulator [Nocardia abscessus]